MVNLWLVSSAPLERAVNGGSSLSRACRAECRHAKCASTALVMVVAFAVANYVIRTYYQGGSEIWVRSIRMPCANDSETASIVIKGRYLCIIGLQGADIE